MRGLSMWRAVITAALLFGGAIPAQAQLAEGVAAVVNDDIISTYEVRQRSPFLLVSYGIELSAANQQRADGLALRELMDEQVQLQAAHKFAIQITSDVLDRTVSDIAASHLMTVEQLQAQLVAAGVGMATLRRRIEAETAWRMLISSRYASRIRISDAQVRDRQQRIANAARATLRRITAPASSRAALQSARHIQSCEGLDQAIAVVQGASIVDLRNFNVPKLLDLDHLEGLSVGQTSEIAESGDQASIFVVCAREANTTDAPSRGEIKGQLIEQELAMIAQRHLSDLRRQATIIKG